MVARKSRKNLNTETFISKEQTYHVAGYVRLSVVKEDQYQDSIATQTAIIQDYIDKNRGEMIFHKMYVDEKVSGTTFERKGFQEMLSDIENGHVNCVIVKDLSRLGRDFLETGYYIEQYFPSKHVRFVSVSDEFDTTNGMKNNKRHESMNGIRIPMTNLFNEKYVEDIRSKTQFTIDYMIRHGKYVAPRAPYGYMKDPADCHALVVNPEAATVVKDIFSMADKGSGLNEIVRQLNAAKILPPLEYAKTNGLEGNYEQGSGLWNTRSVKKILTNCVYVGDLVQGKQNYLVKDTHEPLVGREAFARIQWGFSKSAEASKEKAKPASDNPLKGKVICGCCGGKMQRRKGSGNADWYFFTCITNNRLGAGNCSGMYIRESIIMDAIQEEISKYVDEHRNVAINHEKDWALLDEKLAGAKKELEICRENFKHSFEQSVLGNASKEQYLQEVDEMRIVERTVLALENDFAQLEEQHQKYQLFRRADTEVICFNRIVLEFLGSVTIHKADCVSVQWVNTKV